jgi:endonuclease/exonuclease/phosphatase family metal-dependent hydrolase
VGPIAIVSDSDGSSPSAADRLAVVTWNLHDGAADLEAFVDRLRGGGFSGGAGPRDFVLLLQEAFRERGPSRAGAPRRHEIVSTARRLRLFLYYAPLVRTGAEGGSADRGNAILSTRPLYDLQVIELPFARQRRLAIAATVFGVSNQGAPWTLRLVDVHLENRAGMRSLWLGSGAARTTQARALLDAIDGAGPLVLGGDFNTWGGLAESAHRLLREAFPGSPAGDGRATFRRFGWRLDHLFFRTPGGRATFARVDQRFGSDHYPLLGWVDVGRSVR